MSEGVGAQLVQTARASAVTSSSRISVQDAVDALRLGGTEVSEKVTRVVVGIRAARDLSGGDVVLAGLIGEVGVEPMHGPGEAVSQVVGPLLGSILENALLQLGGDLGGHSFCFFRRDAGAQSKLVLVIEHRSRDLGDDMSAIQVQAAVGERLQS